MHDLRNLSWSEFCCCTNEIILDDLGLSCKTKPQVCKERWTTVLIHKLCSHQPENTKDITLYCSFAQDVWTTSNWM